MHHKRILVELNHDLEKRCEWYKDTCPEHHCHGYGIVYENHRTHGMARYICIPYVTGLYARQTMQRSVRKSPNEES